MYKYLTILIFFPFLVYADIVSEVSHKYKIPPGLLNALCRVESGLKPATINVEDGGSASLGYCQIKVSTAKYVGYKGHVSSLLKKDINVELAGRYLAYQHKRYGSWDKAVIAYNRGHYKAGYEKKSRYLRKVKLAWTERE